MQKEITAVLRLKDQLSANAKKMQKELRGINKAIEKNRKTLGDLKLKYIAVAAAVAVVSRAVKGALEAQSKQVDAINKLNLSLANQGNLLPGTSQRLQEYASELQKVTTFGDEVIIQNQALLASFGMNEAQLKSATAVALDFATATGRDLQMAVNLLGKAFVGETGELSRYGIVIDKNIPKSEKFAAVMKQMTDRFGGQAKAATATFTGQMQQLGNAFGDVQEAAGKFLGEFLKVGGGMESTLAILERVRLFFARDLIIALGEARARFAEFVAGTFDLMAKLSEKLPKMGPFAAISNMFGDDTPETFRNMAKGQRELADAIREESDAAAIAAGKTLDFKNNLNGLAAGATEAGKPLLELGEGTRRFGREILDVTPHVATLQDHLDRMGDTTGRFAGQLLNVVPTVNAVTSAVEQLPPPIVKFTEILEAAANMTLVFGQTIGRVFGGAASAIGGFSSLFGKESGGFGLSAFTKQFKDAGKIGFKSMLSGLASVLPAIGALVGPIISGLKAAFSRPEYKKIMKDVGRDYGIAISEGLAKEIEAIEKRLDVGRFEASLLKLGDIIREGGGLSASNIGKVTEQFHNLLNIVALGSVSAAEGLQAIGDAFNEMAAGLEKMGTKGAFQMGELINRIRELGLVSAEVQDFIEVKASSAISELGKYFNYLLQQETITGEQAKAALSYMAGAFQAAVMSAGSLVGAIAMLGDSFGQLLERLRGVLGDQNAVLNAMTRYYNFVKSNEEQLGAIAALSNAFKELAAIGIVNRNNIDEFAQAFKQQFEEILGKTKDQNTALAAMGPQIAQLLEAYSALGLQVPEWLANLAAQAKEAGASLEPPEGLPDILKDIRDILVEIGKAFGVAAGEADRFATAARGAERHRGPRPGGHGEPDMAFQHGTPPGGVLFTRPSLVAVAETRPERVWVQHESKAKSAGAGDVNLNIGDVHMHVEGSGSGNPEEDGRRMAAGFIQMIRGNYKNARNEMLREVNRG